MIVKDQAIAALLHQEKKRQIEGVELIASENFVSEQVAAATGSVLTNKYAEGLPGRRYYGGCEVVDQVERLAIDRAKALFGACWANVQPHSGSQANAALMMAVLKPGDKIMGFHLPHGGHLTHGASVNFSGKLYQPVFYGVHPETGCIDWEEVEEIARRERPKMIICGASAYSRDWDYQKLRAAADQVGAFLWADIAHPAGLISKGLLNHPFPHCHFVSTTTHKTLQGPRGGMLLMGQDFENPWGRVNAKGNVYAMSTLLDLAVFPGTQGGPFMHSIAGKAIAFEQALHDAYQVYVRQVQKNAHTMAQAFMDQGYQVVSKGTDNHLFLLDLSSKKLTGKQAQEALQEAAITTNKNLIPFDKQPAPITSGIRIGTAAVTTRGLVQEDMLRIVEWMDTVLSNVSNHAQIAEVKRQVGAYMSHFPLNTLDAVA